MNALELSKRYDNNTIARTIVNLIPHIGGALDTALSSKWTHYHSVRVDDFLNKIATEISTLNDNVINKQFLESEEFYDLIYRIVSNAFLSRCPETRTGYSKVIRAAICQEENVSTLEELVCQIADLREKDFLFLRRINSFFEANKVVSGNTLAEEMREEGYSPYELELHLYRFENLGLLDHPRNTMVGGCNTSFQKLPLFDKFISFLDI